MLALELLALGLMLAFSAVYSGSEIGFYSVSATQVDIDAKSGSRRASLMRWLLADEAALLITILIGNNLALELATHLGESAISRATGIDDTRVLALAVTLGLTPVVFVLGEALPKDVFRQRPHALTGLAAPFIALSRLAFWPLERLLRLVTAVLERAFGLGEGMAAAPLAGREAVRAFLTEGQRHGIIGDSAAQLADNALRIRGIPVRAAMVPWEEVAYLPEDRPARELFCAVRESRHSRLPVLAAGACAAGGGPEPAEVRGYVHQLEVLHGARGRSGDGPDPAVDVLETVRPLGSIEAELPVARALGEFRAAGRRIALVVEGGAVVGLVSVNDLLDFISAEVVR